jgi:hypothetical protein
MFRAMASPIPAGLLAAVPVAAGRVRSWLLAGDPDGTRRRLATRAVLTAGAAALLISRLPLARRRPCWAARWGSWPTSP